ncbi:hypothetical protein NL676_022486 [Syzygium grande]|nr:hypothetical protein NL676_022486 [Syzygium grande]
MLETKYKRASASLGLVRSRQGKAKGVDRGLAATTWRRSPVAVGHDASAVIAEGASFVSISLSPSCLALSQLIPQNRTLPLISQSPKLNSPLFLTAVVRARRSPEKLIVDESAMSSLRVAAGALGARSRFAVWLWGIPP